jgi:hypothetical protein
VSKYEEVTNQMEDRVVQAVKKVRTRLGKEVTDQEKKEIWEGGFGLKEYDDAPDVFVYYSAYKSDGGDVPIDNLDEVPITGKVKIVDGPHEHCWGRKPGSVFESEVMESPTWLELAVQMDFMIREVKDFHHVFLEGVKVVRKEGDVSVCRFITGS